MRKKSNLLVGISVLLMILLCFSSLFILILTKSINDDAKMINDNGVIRGSIQRIIKFEVSNTQYDIVEDEQLIKKVDDLIKRLSDSKWAKNSEYSASFDKLTESWIETKQLIAEHKKNPTEMSKQAILDKSEVIWKESNIAVDNAQYESERKISYFKFLTLMLIVNTFLIIVIIIFLRNYVQKKLEIAANHDPLTGIYNRAFLYAILNKILKDIGRFPRSLSIITFDIDHFKKINDTFGHGIGDMVLKELCRLINENIRSSDVFARIGGEEFLIVTSNTDLEGAAALAEKLRSQVEENIFEGAGHVAISLGVTVYKKGDSIDDLLKRADVALYKAKNNGRNRVEFE